MKNTVSSANWTVEEQLPKLISASGRSAPTARFMSAFGRRQRNSSAGMRLSRIGRPGPVPKPGIHVFDGEVVHESLLRAVAATGSIWSFVAGGQFAVG
jgi:hypothetical protein